MGKFLTSASKHLRATKKQSHFLRFRSYYDLLAHNESDTNSPASKESKTNANIVQRTIAAEENRAMFKKIRYSIKPSHISELNKIMTSRHKDSTEPPMDFQKFLSTTKSDDIIRDTITDSPTIEETLLSFNRQSFCAAAQSKCGQGKILDSLTFSSLSPSARHVVLEGQIPHSWTQGNPILQNFLKEFALPETLSATPSITNDITEDEVATGFKKWRE